MYDIISLGLEYGVDELIGIQRTLCGSAEAVFKDRVLPECTSADRLKARLGTLLNTSRITKWIVAPKLENGTVTAKLVEDLLARAKRRDAARVVAGQSTSLMPKVRAPPYGARMRCCGNNLQLQPRR